MSILYYLTYSANHPFLGHAFAFPKLPASAAWFDDAGCATPCADDENLACGCSDELCGGLAPAEGEEHTRRWAVYEATSPKKKKKGIAAPAKDEM